MFNGVALIMTLLGYLASLLGSVPFVIFFYYDVPLGRALGTPFLVTLGAGFFMWASHENSKEARG